jgi:hypothetical protein
VLFRDLEKIERVEINALHKVMSSYARLVIAAKEFGYSPFHGVIYDPRVYFGSGSYFSSG